MLSGPRLVDFAVRLPWPTNLILPKKKFLTPCCSPLNKMFLTIPQAVDLTKKSEIRSWSCCTVRYWAERIVAGCSNVYSWPVVLIPLRDCCYVGLKGRLSCIAAAASWLLPRRTQNRLNHCIAAACRRIASVTWLSWPSWRIQSWSFTICRLVENALCWM